MANYYPIPSFHFRVDFLFPKEKPNDQECIFNKVSGIGSSIDIKSYPELGNLYNQIQLPTSRKYTNLVLERGLVVNSRIYSWFESSYYDLQIETIPVMVSLLDEKHKPLLSWLFYDAFPVNWSYSSFDSLKNEYFIEKVELKYSSYIELINPTGQSASDYVSNIKKKLK